MRGTGRAAAAFLVLFAGLTGVLIIAASVGEQRPLTAEQVLVNANARMQHAGSFRALTRTTIMEAGTGKVRSDVTEESIFVLGASPRVFEATSGLQAGAYVINLNRAKEPLEQMQLFSLHGDGQRYYRVVRMSAAPGNEDAQTEELLIDARSFELLESISRFEEPGKTGDSPVTIQIVRRYKDYGDFGVEIPENP
jgi:hypothetical protein